MQIQEFDHRDPWLQEFLWQHLVPADIRHDYTKADALAHVLDLSRRGDTVFIGCRESGVVFRCVAHNTKVIEPHIMGNGLRVRSVTQAAIPVAWALGYEKIVVWTQYPALAKAMLSIGLQQDAVIPRYHLQDGELLDLHVLSITKGQHHDHLSAKTLLTR